MTGTAKTAPADRIVKAIAVDAGEPRKALMLTILQPARIAAESAINVEAPSQPVPIIMFLDPSQGAWRPIVLPPGTRWELRPARPAVPRIFAADGRPLA